jgi:hypothetical protein
MQYRDLCNESFELTAASALALQDTHKSIAPAEKKRVQMPFLTLGIFNQPKYLPGRFLNMVIECELTPDAASWLDSTDEQAGSLLTWQLSDINILASVINLDPALDSMLADKVLSGEIPLPIRTWVTQTQMITQPDFNITMTRGVSRLATVVVSYAKAETPTEKESNVLYFPVAHAESAEHQLQAGIKKIPSYPVRGCKEAYYRAKQALCVSATSQHAYNFNYDRFIDDNYMAAFDCEAVCGQAEMSGLNLRGGQQIFWTAKNIGDGTTKPTKAFMHLNYQAMVVMDASGCSLLE